MAETRQTLARAVLGGPAGERRDEIARLRRLLLEYGRHDEGCNAQWGDAYRCRCGWRDVLRELTAPAAPAPPGGRG